jgi:hypothetical protein
LDLAVVHAGSGVLAALHLDVGSAGVGFDVVGIELDGFVEVVQGFQPVFTLHEGECAV